MATEQVLMNGETTIAARRACAALYLVHRPQHSFSRIVPRDGSASLFRPTIICTKKTVARWEAGWSGDFATVWSHGASHASGGWLLLRSNGLDVDYGHLIRGCELPDGAGAGFCHKHDAPPWTLLKGAVWFSPSGIPAWLAGRGVVGESNAYARRQMADLYEDVDLLKEIRTGNW